METLKQKEKPKYSILQNVIFMMGLAWKGRKSVLLLIILVAMLGVGVNLLGLFVAPTILTAVEEQVSLQSFIMTVLSFIIPFMLLRMAMAYCEANKVWKRIDIRLNLMNITLDKFLSTSYANVLLEDFLKKKEQASHALSFSFSATEIIWETLTNLTRNSIGFAIYLLILTSFDPWIKAVIIVTTVVSYFINKRILGWGYRNREEEAQRQKQMGYYQSKIGDTTLAKDIRLFGMNQWLSDVYKSAYSLFQGFVARREKVYLWSDIIDLAFAFARNGIAYLFLIGMVVNENLSPAAFLLYFTAIGGFSTWIGGILEEFTKLHLQSLEISVIREFIDYPEPFAFESGKKLLPNPDGKHEIEARNISFFYHGSDKLILDQINLKIPAGEKLAIVGINGAGKSTLVKILCGLLDPTEGEVLLNGVNIKEYNRRDYYNLFSAVFQDFSIMPGTVAQNISQSVNDFNIQKVEKSLKQAGIWNKIQSLPAGINSKVVKDVYEEAVDLSGGQIQRMMLARALYKNGSILILDEPTAALDPIAENEIYLAYNELAGEKTSIYISHRLASTGFCDRIILLDGNQIAEVGTHEQLLELNGEYAKMFEIQGRYYQEEVREEGEIDE